MIYVIFGPTGSGKTRVANRLASSLNAPLINGDAFQIYKEMDIGTSKLSKDDPLFSSYYMIDIVSPDKTYSVKEYQCEGRKILNSLLLKNKDVIIVGGTGLYIKALLYDYSFNEESDNEIDNDLINLSNVELHNILESLDPNEANKIHLNNRKRVLRAIMLIRHAKESKSDILAKQEHKPIYKDIKFLYLSPNRETLYESINNRVDEMIKAGLVEEVKNLINKYDLSITASQGIGYKEIIGYLNDEYSLDFAIELIKKRTRNYAKRQVTFFNHQFENYLIFNNGEELFNYLK